MFEVKCENNLFDLRREWEDESDVIFERQGKPGGRLGSIVVSLTRDHSEKVYRVMRYFLLTDRWEASCDYEGLDLGEAINRIVDLFE